MVRGADGSVSLMRFVSASVAGSAREMVSLVGLLGLVIAVVIFVYASGSFLLMRKYVDPRRGGHEWRALLREIWIAGVTQPLLPLFYWAGYRMDLLVGLRHWRWHKGRAQANPDGDAGTVPIVLVHGYMQNRVGFIGLARALARRKPRLIFGFNYPWFLPLASNAKRLERFVQKVCNETGARAVDLVCHSMGGLIAMEMMRDEARRDSLNIRRCVTIATPHAGVMWKGPFLGVGSTALRRGSKFLLAHAGTTVSVPTLSVYSTHDNVVHPKESSSLSLRGGRDVEVNGLAHLAILFSPEVASHVTAFLDEPDLLGDVVARVET